MLMPIRCGQKTNRKGCKPVGMARCIDKPGELLRFMLSISRHRVQRAGIPPCRGTCSHPL